MSFIYKFGPSGPDDGDLPEFDPEVLDAFPRAVAEMQYSQLLNRIIDDAIEQEDFILTRDQIPLDCPLISAISLFYPSLTATEIQEYTYQALNSVLTEEQGLLRELHAQSKTVENLALQNEMLMRKIKGESKMKGMEEARKVWLSLSQSLRPSVRPLGYFNRTRQ